MYRLVGVQQNLAVSLRLLKDGREVGTALISLTEMAKFAGKQSAFIDFEPTAQPLPPEVRREEIGELSPREAADFRGAGEPPPGPAPQTSPVRRGGHGD